MIAVTEVTTAQKEKALLVAAGFIGALTMIAVNVLTGIIVAGSLAFVCLLTDYAVCSLTEKLALVQHGKKLQL